MMAFSRLNGAIDRGNKFSDIENQNGDQVSEVFVGKFAFCQDKIDRPPKEHAVERHQRNLGNQRLRAVPSRKKRRLSVGHKIDEGGNYVQNRQR